MKIAQVSPLYESVPPRLYGGTERVVYNLTEELVRKGHQVTLFASGDSVTKAELVPVCNKGLRLDKKCEDYLAHHMLQLQMVQDRLKDFDIIHYHTDYFHFPLSLNNPVPHITTLHGRLDIPDLQNLYKRFHTIPLVSISDSQRRPIPKINWLRTIYHGIPTNLYKPNYGEGKYLAFIGRFSKEKRVDRAIEIAKKSGIKLKIAAKLDTQFDQEFYEKEVKHLLDDPIVDYVGEIGEKEKNKFLSNAIALLFPIDWPEPFGIVMIEAMACGTPVIAYNCGSVPEIVEPGENGFIVKNINEAIKAVNKIDLISRKRCRELFELRFSAARMTADYLKLYQQMVDQTSMKSGKVGKLSRMKELKFEYLA